MLDKKQNENNDQDYKKAKNYLDLYIKIEPAAIINLEHIKVENEWDFFYNSQKMLSSKELDMLMDKIKTNRLPDMFYGYNRFYICNAKHNFLLEIDPIKMVDLCLYNERKHRFINIKENKIINKDTIYFIPDEIKVQFWDKWKNIKVDRTDIQTKDTTYDWTFSTAYMGEIYKLDTHKIYEENLEKFRTQYNLNHSSVFNIDNLDIITSDDDFKKKYNVSKIQENEEDFVNIELTNEELPIDKLGRDNPILHYNEINLFDDELNDNGLAQGNFR